jgi:hypothetical protein
MPRSEEMNRKFRRLPVIVDAVQWRETMGAAHGVVLSPLKTTPPLYILEERDGERRRVMDGDWIITDQNGHKERCCPETFAVTYEAVEEKNP